jgi:hypothetical protein
MSGLYSPLEFAPAFMGQYRAIEDLFGLHLIKIVASQIALTLLGTLDWLYESCVITTPKETR